MRTSDAHLHDLSCGVPDLYIACGTRPEDWDSLPAEGNGIRCYGIHPWYADQWSPEAEAALRTRLAEDPNAGVGEIGLDSVRQGGNAKEAFMCQMSIASELGRVTSVHNVGSDEGILEAVREYGSGCRSIILHAFSSESVSVRWLASMNCYFSLSPKVLKRSPARIKALLDKIPDDRLLLETDCPYGSDIGGLALMISKIKVMDAEAFCDMVYDNLGRAIS